MTAHISEDGLNREESVAEHTKKTACLCAEKGKRCNLSQVLSLCGLLHDMGKEKHKFDNYIHADEKTRQKLRGTIAHASTGAKYIYDQRHDNSNDAKMMTEMISYAIAAHHGIFDCVDIDHTDLFSKKMSAIEDYDEACRNAKKDYLDEVDLDKIFSDALEEFSHTQDKIKELYKRLQSLIQSKKIQNEKETLLECRFFLFSCLQRLVLSILIDSDWEATTDFMNDVDTCSKQAATDNREKYEKTIYDSFSIFEKAQENFAKYMQKKQQSIDVSKLSEKERDITNARNTLQRECREFAEHPAGIYCLPLPTGGGKTLSSLAYALEYCKKHRETERVIYVSPYISITEQNAKVFRDAIGVERWILEHHSSVVSVPQKEERADEDYRADILPRYDINWEEPFICTTFVQFMNTLFSDKSESIRRMHRLVNAVVIIDEVQSMPLKCVHTFNYMINFLNHVCNTDIVLCTATQPALEEPEFPICYSEPKYMIQNVNEWFHRFERVQIHTPKAGEKYTYESLADEITKQTARFKSILVVLNTKSAVRKLYDILKAQNVNVEYLTTNLCAAHRSDKIEAIQETLRERQDNIVVISTNLIEAGVDISFECVYRSMTGLDSLAQTAGRCNRNGELEYGTIYLIILEDENTGNMEELQQNKRVTAQIIHQYEQGDKADSLLMPQWMEQYYKIVYRYASDKMNFPIAGMDKSVTALLSRGFGIKNKTNLLNPAYKTAGQAYRVIDDNSFGVIVPYKKGTEIIEALQTTSDLSAVRAYIRQAQRYTVNVRSSQLKRFDGLIQPVSDRIAGLYMVSAPGAYSLDYGIAPEWETLIF